MSAFFGSGFWAPLFREFHCRHCGGREGFASRPRNLLERYLLPALRLRPARCGDCYDRSWRPIGVVLLPRQSPMRFDPEEMAASARAADHREAGKQTDPKTDDRRRIA